MRQIKTSQVKLVIFLSICLLFIVSCKKESVCSLTPEQAPEVRGFRLGMSFENFKNRFKEIDFSKVKTESTTGILLHFYDLNSPKWADETSSYNLNRQQYPDFDGIQSVNLTFSNQRLTQIAITYNATKDSDFKSVFVAETAEALNLNQWTNWEVSESSDPDYRIHTNKYVKTLLCQKFQVKIAVVESILTDPDLIAKHGISYYPYLYIEETNDSAVSDSQKQALKEQQEQDQRSQSLKETQEERKKTETFKP